jgi:toxin secretion/phage lysis holin
MEIVNAVLNLITRSAPGMLLALIVLDVVSGLLKSAKQKRWSSDVSYAGMTRKLGMLLALGLCYVLESYSKLPFVIIASLFYSATEGMSLVENLDALGVPIPPQVAQYFKKLNTTAPPASSFTDVVTSVTKRDSDDDTTLH